MNRRKRTAEDPPDSPEVIAARKDVRAWFCKQVTMALEPLKPGKKPDYAKPAILPEALQL